MRHYTEEQLQSIYNEALQRFKSREESETRIYWDIFYRDINKPEDLLSEDGFAESVKVGMQLEKAFVEVFGIKFNEYICKDRSKLKKN